MTLTPTFDPPPPKVGDHILISFPTDNILLGKPTSLPGDSNLTRQAIVTLNRPSSMNCVSTEGHIQLTSIWEWYDSTPSLRCAIVTGARIPQKRAAFCAGADLKEWNLVPGRARPPADGGFAGLSGRRGKKPVISAVHGICFGGGLEAAGNTDLILAHSESVFALPETSRGVVAISGLLPRLALIVGMQRASELALTGRVLSAHEAQSWGLVNEVVDGDVVERAIEVARKIVGMSPDSVIVSRAALRGAWDGAGVDDAATKVENGVWKQLQAGENIQEGLRAFVEKREAKWVASKL